MTMQSSGEITFAQIQTEHSGSNPIGLNEYYRGGSLTAFNPQNTNYYNGYLILSLTDINDDVNCNEVNGDFNYDNSLDVIDLVTVVNHILSPTTIELCQFLATDHDINESLDVLDIIHFLNEIIES